MNIKYDVQKNVLHCIHHAANAPSAALIDLKGLYSTATMFTEKTCMLQQSSPIKCLENTPLTSYLGRWITIGPQNAVRCLLIAGVILFDAMHSMHAIHHLSQVSDATVMSFGGFPLMLALFSFFSLAKQ